MISESGVKSIEEVKKIKRACLNGALIGEALMKADNPYLELLKYISVKFNDLKLDL